MNIQTVIWWVRRDLRLKDNQALQTADPENRQVIPVFILDPMVLKREAEKRKAFLFNGLHGLDKSLRASGSRLVIRAGKPVEELLRIVNETGATAIFAEEDYTPYARKRDQMVAESLPLQLLGGSSCIIRGLWANQTAAPIRFLPLTVKHGKSYRCPILSRTR